MGRKSIKEDKSVYFRAREEAGLTRAQASEIIGTISESRLEKLETGKLTVYPEDVVDLAAAYKRPELCNYYCTHECRIGQEMVPEVTSTSLAEITLGILSSLNTLEKQKNRLVEITADGAITDDELPDFAMIQKELDRVDRILESLKLWVSGTIASGKLDREKLKKLLKD